MNEKNLLLNISLDPPTSFAKIIYDMKLWKFEVESFLGHL